MEGVSHVKFDLTFTKKKAKKPAPQETKPKSDVAYRVGTCDGKTKAKRTKLPLLTSLKYCVTYASYLDAHMQAKRDSHFYSECDFDSGTDGARIVLLQFRGDKIVGVWEFDKRGRERTVLALPRMA